MMRPQPMIVARDIQACSRWFQERRREETA